jgi:hypothetical protein
MFYGLHRGVSRRARGAYPGGPAWILYGIFLLSLLISGCAQKRLAPLPPPLSRAEILDNYNANVAAVPAFSAQVAQWQVQLTDDQDKTHRYHDRGGKVFYRPGQSPAAHPRLYLQCSTLLESKALVVGANQDEFWMYSKIAGRFWWGKYEYLGQACSASMPINPQLFLELIGLSPLPAVASQPPYPLLKIGPEDYVIEFVVRGDDGFSLQREIILDRRTNLPREINAYSPSGARLMQSRLADWQQVGPALLPADIMITAASDQDSLRLHLRQFKPDSTDRGPLFQRPAHVPDIKEYTQIDRRCEHD